MGRPPDLHLTHVPRVWAPRRRIERRFRLSFLSSPDRLVPSEANARLDMFMRSIFLKLVTADPASGNLAVGTPGVLYRGDCRISLMEHSAAAVECSAARAALAG